jgi:hypothetical protein
MKRKTDDHRILLQECGAKQAVAVTEIELLETPAFWSFGAIGPTSTVTSICCEDNSSLLIRISVQTLRTKMTRKLLLTKTSSFRPNHLSRPAKTSISKRLKSSINRSTLPAHLSP